MSSLRSHVTVAVLAFLAGAMLAGAHVALAVFNDSAAGGPLTLISATLSPAKEVTPAQVNCRVNKNPEIELDWSATGSTYATSYTVERATAAAGPYTSVASVAIGKTSYTDTSGTLSSSATYYYRVAALYRSWSAPSTVASVKTLSKFCL
ncbi:MAG TPA: fibronectin type III domain-containing protein [Solirubrobacteraceae bacterium]|jgi:hypothetical protein|nr:fibronectin type III domain-containing protein [Solirubrobacteraceae bacterium]